MSDVAREIHRQAYLGVLGVDQYVSRRALPGAAETIRYRVESRAPAPVSDQKLVSDQPGIQRDESRGAVQSPRTAPRSDAPVSRPGTAEVASFRIAAVQAGGWLWLEDLGDMPLAQEQVQLMAAMATAVAGGAAKPLVAQFDWPMHNNQQLDLGAGAAATSLGSFIERQLADGQCAGIVLLGSAVGHRLPERLSCGHRIELPGSRDMLENPGLKRQAWAGLMPHVRS